MGFDLVVVGRGGKERLIPAAKIIIDRSTDRGEPADYYERMPHSGKRWIHPDKIVQRIERTTP
jgi:hypothetical protein